MSDSVLELIMKNRAAALAGITQAGGFDNTISSVQRPLQDGQDFTSLPMCLLFQDTEEREGEKTSSYIYKKVTLGVLVAAKIDAAVDTRSADEYLNSLQADVERAWMVDATCGGYARNTFFMNTERYVPVVGMPDIGRVLLFEVQYKHQLTNPKAQF